MGSQEESENVTSYSTPLDQSNYTDFTDPRTLMQIGFFRYKKYIKLFKWVESIYAFLYSYMIETMEKG